MKRKTVALKVPLALALSAGIAGAQPPPPGAGIRLCTGAIADRDRGQVYLMRPGGGIEAVLLSGEIAWTTNVASKPLQLLGSTLLAQTESLAPDGSLAVERLSPTSGAQVGSTVNVSLPAGVWGSIDDGPGQSLATEASIVSGAAVVRWQAIERPVGALFGPPASVQSGVSMLNPTTGAVAATAAAFPQAPPTAVPEGQGIDGVPGEQFYSADGRHVLVSERIADDSVWEKYRWSIHSLDSGERLNDVFHHLSRVAFVVIGSTFVYESPAFLRRLGEDWIDAPLELRAIDLSTGSEIWTRPLRDTLYRGPMPP